MYFPFRRFRWEKYTDTLLPQDMTSGAPPGTCLFGRFGRLTDKTRQGNKINNRIKSREKAVYQYRLFPFRRPSANLVFLWLGRLETTPAHVVRHRFITPTAGQSANGVDFCRAKRSHGEVAQKKSVCPNANPEPEYKRPRNRRNSTVHKISGTDGDATICTLRRTDSKPCTTRDKFP